MKVILKPVGKEPRQILIPNELHVLQQLVGGYIETLTLFEDACLLCDEEGKLKGKPYNCTVLGEPIVGDLLLVGTRGDEFCDVPVSVEAINKMRLFA